METLSACILCGSRDIHSADPEARFWACRACGLLFDNPRPDSGAIFAFYSKPAQYKDWVAEAKARDRLWKRRLAKLARFARPGSILDVGAGIGQFLHHARARFRPAEGTEVSASGIGLAKEKYGIELRRGEVGSIDFGGTRFDNITLFHVLEHVPSPRETLAVLRELLAPGGVLFIAVPNDIASLGAVKRRWFRKLGLARGLGRYGLPPLNLDGGMDEIHLSHFTPGALSRYLSANGFEVLELGLDPFYAESGARLAGHAMRYWICSAFHRLTGVNVYGTIWVAARRRP
jgi:SAM-dependent methyltransferase